MSDANNKKHNCTTLCYIEKEDSYLMMHRVKKEKDINKAAYKLTKKMVKGDSSFITLIYGADVTEEKAQQLYEQHNIESSDTWHVLSQRSYSFQPQKFCEL